MLTLAGYTRLSERDEWTLTPGGKYFFTRNMSSIVAFAVGEKYQPGNGFNIIGAHTDSPCPKLKPVSAIAKGGFLSVGRPGVAFITCHVALHHKVCNSCQLSKSSGHLPNKAEAKGVGTRPTRGGAAPRVTSNAGPAKLCRHELGT